MSNKFSFQDYWNKQHKQEIETRQVLYNGIKTMLEFADRIDTDLDEASRVMYQAGFQNGCRTYSTKLRDCARSILELINQTECIREEYRLLKIDNDSKVEFLKEVFEDECVDEYETLIPKLKEVVKPVMEEWGKEEENE